MAESTELLLAETMPAIIAAAKAADKRGYACPVEGLLLYGRPVLIGPRVDRQSDWIHDGVEVWDTAAATLSRDATSPRRGVTYQLNGVDVTADALRSLRGAIDAALSAGDDG